MELMITEPLDEWLGVSEIIWNNVYGYFRASAILDFIEMIAVSFESCR